MTATSDPSELEFPLECHFRIITERVENMHFVIETVLMGLGVSAPVEQGNSSGAGNYVSYAVSTMVDSLDAMNAIDRELRLIQGVKMVL
jgi:putative lipoic acid-binding regulatory protein